MHVLFCLYSAIYIARIPRDTGKAPSTSARLHNFPFGLNRALRYQTWLRKIDARSCIDLSRCRTNRQLFYCMYSTIYITRIPRETGKASSSSARFHNFPFGLNRALRCQTWLRKIDARSCVDLSRCRTNRRNFLHRFANPCLATHTF